MDFLTTQHAGSFIATYTNKDSGGFRWWLAQLRGATKRSTKTVVYRAPKGSRVWGYSKHDDVMNITWVDRSNPSGDPLLFKVCEENADQVAPIVILLPVVVDATITAGGVYSVTQATANLVDEWCDHVAEIKDK